MTSKHQLYVEDQHPMLNEKRSPGLASQANYYHLLLIGVLLYAFQRDNPLWLMMLTADNLFTAFSVVTPLFIAIDPTPSTPHPSHSHPTPQTLGIFTRYVFYTAVATSCLIIDIMTWWYFHPVLICAAVLAVFPPVTFIILRLTTVQKSLQMVTASYEKTLYLWLCQHFARLLNESCRHQLELTPHITAEELYQTLQHTDSNYLRQFLKILIANTLLQYMESPGKNTYTRILRALYKGGHLIEIPAGHHSIIRQVKNTRDDDVRARHLTDQEQLAREVLRRVVIYRRWGDLCDPEVLNHLISLITSHPSNYLQQRLQLLLSLVRYAILRTGTVMTFVMFFQPHRPGFWLPLVSTTLHLPDLRPLWQGATGWRLLSYLLTWWSYTGSYWILWTVLSEIAPIITDLLKHPPTHPHPDFPTSANNNHQVSFLWLYKIAPTRLEILHTGLRGIAITGLIYLTTGQVPTLLVAIGGVLLEWLLHFPAQSGRVDDLFAHVLFLGLFSAYHMTHLWSLIALYIIIQMGARAQHHILSARPPEAATPPDVKQSYVGNIPSTRPSHPVAAPKMPHWQVIASYAPHHS